VKFDMFEWAIEKATELGVTTIVPLSAARSEKALLTSSVKRAERWRKILLEASQQSRRVRVPVLGELAAPEIAFASHKDGLRIMLSERPDAPSIRNVLEGQRNAKATLAIGPEGGWTDAEVQASRKQGFLDASLGRLILRTETAVAAALASLNYALGGD
jgi:16S rRNA (uracil1498-N3)-methyltransferase